MGAGAGDVVANLAQRLAGLAHKLSGRFYVGPFGGPSTVAGLEARRLRGRLVAERLCQVEFVVDRSKVRGVVGDPVEILH
jgi:hypothetical protein